MAGSDSSGDGSVPTFLAHIDLLGSMEIQFRQRCLVAIQHGAISEIFSARRGQA
jgi:hypothetical protein